MQKIIFICIILQLFYFISRVESLVGSKVTVGRYGEYSFIASIRSYPQMENFCTGILVTKKHVLTVQDCIVNKKPEAVRIVFEFVSLQEVAVAYQVASWVTYDGWADKLKIPKEDTNHRIASIELAEKVYNIVPVRLNELNTKQIQRKTATITGWGSHSNRILLEASVKILNDEDCVRKVRLITDITYSASPDIVCTAATPYVLLDWWDVGAPLLDEHTKLLGLNLDFRPDQEFAWGYFSNEFLRQHMVNLHFSVDFYRNFIVNTTNYR